MKAQSNKLKRLGQAILEIKRTPWPPANEPLQTVKTSLIEFQLMDQAFADRLTIHQWDTLIGHLSVEGRTVVYTEDWLGPYGFMTWFSMRFCPDSKRCVGKLILFSRIKVGRKFVERYRFPGGAAAFRSILRARFSKDDSETGASDQATMLVAAQLQQASRS